MKNEPMENEPWKTSMDEPNRTIRVSRLSDQGAERDLAHTTPEERIGMMWQLAVDAWAFMGEDADESRFQRDVVRLIRRKR